MHSVLKTKTEAKTMKIQKQNNSAYIINVCGYTKIVKDSIVKEDLGSGGVGEGFLSASSCILLSIPPSLVLIPDGGKY